MRLDLQTPSHLPFQRASNSLSALTVENLQGYEQSFQELSLLEELTDVVPDSSRSTASDSSVQRVSSSIAEVAPNGGNAGPVQFGSQQRNPEESSPNRWEPRPRLPVRSISALHGINVEAQQREARRTDSQYSAFRNLRRRPHPPDLFAPVHDPRHDGAGAAEAVSQHGVPQMVARNDGVDPIVPCRCTCAS